MQEFIAYFAVFTAVVAEGEVALVASSLLAQKDILNLQLVLFTAFGATLIMDWTCYFAGKILGDRIFLRFPALSKKTDRPRRILQKWPILTSFTYRYLYGFRIITLLMMGMSGMNNKLFLLYSFLSTLMWTLLFGLGGFYFGHTIEKIFRNMEGLAWPLIVSLILGVMLVFTLRWAIKRFFLNRKSNKKM